MTTVRVVTLPNGRQCRLSVYVASWRTLKATPPDQQVTDFSWHPKPARDVLRALEYGLHDRINRHIPGYGGVGHQMVSRLAARRWPPSARSQHAPPDPCATARRPSAPGWLHRITTWEA